MRQPRWLGKVFGLTALTDQLPYEVIPEADLEELTSPTIIRIRGTFTIKLNASQLGAYQATSYRMGLIVAHKQLTGVGDISVDDLTIPWLWYHSGVLWAQQCEREYWNGSSAVSYQKQDNGYRREVVHIDVAGMRKIDRNQRLILVMKHVDSAGSPNNTEIAGHVRVLVKE